MTLPGKSSWSKLADLAGAAVALYLTARIVADSGRTQRELDRQTGYVQALVDIEKARQG